MGDSECYGWVRIFGIVVAHTMAQLWCSKCNGNVEMHNTLTGTPMILVLPCGHVNAWDCNLLAFSIHTTKAFYRFGCAVVRWCCTFQIQVYRNGNIWRVYASAYLSAAAASSSPPQWRTPAANYYLVKKLWRTSERVNVCETIWWMSFDGNRRRASMPSPFFLSKRVVCVRRHYRLCAILLNSCKWKYYFSSLYPRYMCAAHTEDK